MSKKRRDITASGGCHDCGAILEIGQKQHLHSHVNRHFRFHYFQCTTCNYRSTYKSVVKGHKIIHTGIKHSVCSKCGVEFRNKQRLRDHFLYHHVDINSFKCEKCGKTFKSTKGQNCHEKRGCQVEKQKN